MISYDSKLSISFCITCLSYHAIWYHNRICIWLYNGTIQSCAMMCCAVLCCAVLCCAVLQCEVHAHCIPLHPTASHYIPLHLTTSHCISLHLTAPHCISLHLTTVLCACLASPPCATCGLTDRQTERWLNGWLKCWPPLWQVGICENVAAGNVAVMFLNIHTK